MNLYVKSAYSASILQVTDRAMSKRKRKLTYGCNVFALWLFFEYLGYATDRRGAALLRHINRGGGGEQRKIEQKKNDSSFSQSTSSTQYIVAWKGSLSQLRSMVFQIYK